MRAAQSRQAQGARPLEQGRPLRRPLVGRGWSVRSIAVIKHTRVSAWQACPRQTTRIVCSGAFGSPAIGQAWQLRPRGRAWQAPTRLGAPGASALQRPARWPCLGAGAAERPPRVPHEPVLPRGVAFCRKVCRLHRLNGFKSTVSLWRLATVGTRPPPEAGRAIQQEQKSKLALGGRCAQWPAGLQALRRPCSRQAVHDDGGTLRERAALCAALGIREAHVALPGHLGLIACRAGPARGDLTLYSLMPAEGRRWVTRRAPRPSSGSRAQRTLCVQRLCSRRVPRRPGARAGRRPGSRGARTRAQRQRTRTAGRSRSSTARRAASRRPAAGAGAAQVLPDRSRLCARCHRLGPPPARPDRGVCCGARRRLGAAGAHGRQGARGAGAPAQAAAPAASSAAGPAREPPLSQRQPPRRTLLQRRRRRAAVRQRGGALAGGHPAARGRAARGAGVLGPCGRQHPPGRPARRACGGAAERGAGQRLARRPRARGRVRGRAGRARAAPAGAGCARGGRREHASRRRRRRSRGVAAVGVGAPGRRRGRGGRERGWGPGRRGRPAGCVPGARAGAGRAGRGLGAAGGLAERRRGGQRRGARRPCRAAHAAGRRPGQPRPWLRGARHASEQRWRCGSRCRPERHAGAAVDAQGGGLRPDAAVGVAGLLLGLDAAHAGGSQGRRPLPAGRSAAF